MPGRKSKDFRYVFPSQGKAMIRHHRIILGWSLVAGLVVSAALALVLWFIGGGFSY